MSIYQECMELEQLLADCADPNTGEILESDDEAYQQLKQELTHDGLRRLAMVRVNKMTLFDGIENEIIRLEAAKKRICKEIDWIEDYMLKIYDITPKDKKEKVQAGTFIIGVRKSKRCIIDDEKFKDARFITNEIVKKIDKSAVKDAIENNNEAIEGASIIENRNLTVK